MNTIILIGGSRITFDRVTRARMSNGIPAYVIENDHTIEYQAEYWEDTHTHTVCVPVVNHYTGEVYGFLPKTADLPSIVYTNSNLVQINPEWRK
jgi:hypothetical protein